MLEPFRVLLAVIEEGSLNRAATRLHSTQTDADAADEGA